MCASWRQSVNFGEPTHRRNKPHTNLNTFSSHFVYREILKTSIVNRMHAHKVLTQSSVQNFPLNAKWVCVCVGVCVAVCRAQGKWDRLNPIAMANWNFHPNLSIGAIGMTDDRPSQHCGNDSEPRTPLESHNGKMAQRFRRSGEGAPRAMIDLWRRFRALRTV